MTSEEQKNEKIQLNEIITINRSVSANVRAKLEECTFVGIDFGTSIAITLLVRGGKGSTGFTGLTGLDRANGRATSMTSPRTNGTGAISSKSPYLTVAQNPVNPVNPVKQPARIFYRDIGDYLSREKKLEIVRDMRSMLDPKMQLVEIHPNEKNDWINQRDGLLETLIPIGDKDDKKNQTAFLPNYSCGLKTQRDTWCYNFSTNDLSEIMKSSIDHYMSCLGQEPVYDAVKISWTRAMLNQHEKKTGTSFDSANVRLCVYRPFCKQHLYMDRFWNEMVYQIPKLFPTSAHKNRVICTLGAGVTRPFSCLMTDEIPDVQLMMNVQCFPL